MYGISFKNSQPIKPIVELQQTITDMQSINNTHPNECKPLLGQPDTVALPNGMINPITADQYKFGSVLSSYKSNKVENYSVKYIQEEVFTNKDGKFTVTQVWEPKTDKQKLNIFA